MKILTLFKAVFKREWLEWKRYPFNLVSAFITLYILFLLIFLGYSKYAAHGPKFGERLDGLVVGFTLWMLTMTAMSTLSGELLQEARYGTLEQLYMTPMGFGLLCIFRIISSFILNLIFVCAILIVMMLTTQRFLHIDILSLAPLLILSIMSVYGVGFFVGGLALVFKQVQSFLGIIQFAFIGFIAAPVDKIPILKALPLALGANLISKVMIKSLSISQFNITDILLLIINGFGYFLLGFYTFNFLLRVARQRGLLGHY